MTSNTMNEMHDTQTTIERIVMQRVHLIHALRFAISSGIFSTVVTLLALWGIGREVWVAQVLQNAPTHLLDLPQFYFAAFLHTKVVVQALIILAVAALLFVLREIIRAFAYLSSSETF